MCHQNRYVVRIVKNVLYILSDDPLIHGLLQSYLGVMLYFILFSYIVQKGYKCSLYLSPYLDVHNVFFACKFSFVDVE